MVPTAVVAHTYRGISRRPLCRSCSGTKDDGQGDGGDDGDRRLWFAVETSSEFVTASLDLSHTSICRPFISVSVHACKRKHAACHQPTHHTIQAKETKELLQDKEHMEDVAKCVGWLGVVEVSVRGNVRLGS